MAFVPITDLKVADKLWEAGLLWFKYPGDDLYGHQLDDTYSNEHDREYNKPSYADYVDYFILVEE